MTIEPNLAPARTAVLSMDMADQDADLHTCLLDKLFPRRGTVVAAEDFLVTIET